MAVLGVLGVLAAVVAAVLANSVVSQADTLPEVIRAGGFTFVIILAMVCVVFLTAAICTWALSAFVARRSDEADQQQQRIIDTTQELTRAITDLRDRLDAADAEATRHAVRMDDVEATLRQVATAERIIARVSGEPVRGFRSAREMVPGQGRS